MSLTTDNDYEEIESESSDNSKNNNESNIERTEQYLLSGICPPTNDTRNEFFAYTVSEAMKKKLLKWYILIMNKVFIPLIFYLIFLMEIFKFIL